MEKERKEYDYNISDLIFEEEYLNGKRNEEGNDLLNIKFYYYQNTKTKIFS